MSTPTTPKPAPRDLPGPGLYALTDPDTLTPAERKRITELAALDADDYAADVEAYVAEANLADRRVFWSPTLADRTAHALAETAESYNLRLTAPGAVTDRRTRSYLEQALARVSAERKQLDTAIKQARTDGEGHRRAIGNILGHVHADDRRRASHLLAAGHHPREIVEMLRAEGDQPPVATYLHRMEQNRKSSGDDSRRFIAAVCYEVEGRTRRRARALLQAGHSIAEAVGIIRQEKQERQERAAEDAKASREERKELRQRNKDLLRRVKELEKELARLEHGQSLGRR